jgi:hypothetical protein
VAAWGSEDETDMEFCCAFQSIGTGKDADGRCCGHNAKVGWFVQWSTGGILTIAVG